MLTAVQDAPGETSTSAWLLYTLSGSKRTGVRENAAEWRIHSVRVALFIPCYVDLINPEVGVSVVRILRRLGVELVYPEGQTCCGQPAFNSGFSDGPRGVARHFLDVFEKERWDYVVCPSGSCATM